MGGAKGGSQTIGYKYYMSLLMGFGRGPMSELVEIKAGDKTAWPLNGESMCLQQGQSSFYINAGKLFGGDDKEGGIEGPAKMLWGTADQVLPGEEIISGKRLPGVKATIAPNDPMPALRGVTCLWYDGEVSSMNPYPKEWKARLRRHIHGWKDGVAWYPEKCIVYMSGPQIVTQKQAIRAGDHLLAQFIAKGGSAKQNVQTVVPGNIKAMNGAHIIYQCVTDSAFGRGRPVDEIDVNSFVYAANQLCNEGFGLCFFWQRQEDVDQFIQIVLDHIGGVLYTDRSTGLLTLRLIRNDYDIATLPVFEPGKGLLNIITDDSGSQDVAYNEVVVKYHDPISNTDGEARAQNVGARISQGSTNSLSKEYPGIPTKDLAARVAVRELIVQSAGLKKYKVRLDRSGWRIAPGMPFVVKCPQRGIAQIVLRAGEITDSSIQDGGYIEVSALEDVFSLPATGMVVPEESNWTPPVTDPVPPDAQAGFELAYIDLATGLTQADLDALDPGDSYVGMAAVQPVTSQLTYEFMVKPDGGEFEDEGTFSFTPAVKIAAAIGPATTSVALGERYFWPDHVGGLMGLLNGERVSVTTDPDDSSMIVLGRGVADTIPHPADAGSWLYLIGDDIASSRTTYSAGEEVKVAAATKSTSATLAEEDYLTPLPVVQFIGRQGRPYPPGKLTLDGVSVFEATGEHVEPVFAWASRNRLTQADQMVDQNADSVAPEAGTTYKVEIKDKDGTLLREEDVGTDLTFTYTAAMQGEDGGPNSVRVNVRAVRDGLESWEDYDVPVTIKGGYGYSYGNNYGG